MQRSAAAISESLKKVPPFPPIAAKLLKLLARPAVDANEIADLIASDATFTARLLQRVNSAQFGAISEVTSVRRAVALLGLDHTRRITLAHATAAFADSSLGTEAMRRCWQHTVATAVIADEISSACEAFAGAAFTAGIMHDIGRLGLLVAYPQEYEQVIRNAAERSLDVLDFEEEEFGANHATAGRLLAERWGLPAEMGVIAGRHHDPCGGAELDLLRIVHVACRMADVLGYDVVKPLHPSNPAEVLAELPQRARERLAQSSERLCRRIEEQIQEFGSGASEAPEETLALLASTTALHDSDVAAPVEAKQRRWAQRPTVVLWIIVGLAVVASAVLWLHRN